MKKELKIKQELCADDTVGLFNEISKSLSEGTISIEYGDQQITLKPGCRIESVIEGSIKKGKQKLSIELSWREGDPVCTPQPALKISSQEPVVQEIFEAADVPEGSDAVMEEDNSPEVSEDTESGLKD